MPYTNLRPLCPGSICALINHPSTVVHAEKTIHNFNCQERPGEPDTAKQTLVGVIASKNGRRLIGYAYDEVKGVVRLCEFNDEDVAEIFKNPGFYYNSRYSEILAAVLFSPNGFTIKIKDGLKKRLLSADRGEKDALCFYYGEDLFQIRSIFELIQFVREQFPDIELHMIRETEFLADGAMFWKDGQVLGFWKDNLPWATFECCYPPFGNAEPFTKLLNVIGLQAVQK